MQLLIRTAGILLFYESGGAHGTFDGSQLKVFSTCDIGRVAAKHFSDPNQFNGMTTELATWEGCVHDLASAMEEVTNKKTVGKLAMPKFFCRLFLGCLHIMCEFFEAGGALKSPSYDI